MAAGDVVELKKIKDPIVAIDAASATYVWVVTKSGQIMRYTIADGTVTFPARVRGDVKCIYCNNTTAYLGMGDGRLLSVTVADGANSILKRFDCAIVSLSVLATLIYIGTADGRLHSYAIS
jgi:hypothetical protein